MTLEAAEEAKKTLLSGYTAQGRKVKEFEEALGKRLSNNHTVTVNSGTSAIHLAIDTIKFLDHLPANTVVLSSPLTCAATNLPVLHNGFRIRWCDVDRLTLNIDLDDVVQKLDSTTRILIFVDWGGYPIDHERLLSIKDYYQSKFGHELHIIEDAAHAFGSTDYGKPIGSFDWLFTAFSFQSIKHLTTGDGGLLVTPEHFYKQARIARWFGLDRDNKLDFRSCQDIHYPGYKFHMNDVCASIGLENLKVVDEFIDKQRINSEFLANAINNPKIHMLEYDKFNESSCWLFTIFVDDRETFVKYMLSKEIEVNPVHVRNDKLSVFKKHSEHCTLKTLDHIDKHRISIPNGWWLNIDELQYIAETINAY
jgi:dTDP-4-amino-4,6-dideoxygalactose transaminase